VVAAGTVAGVAVTSTHDATPAAAATFTGTNFEHNVSASVTEWPKAWGAALEVHVTGAVSGSYVDKCQLVAVAADGTKDVAGSWAATPSGKITAQGATSMTPAQIAWFEIVRSDGEMLVKIPVQPAARSDT
jgi:hypothetical protein